MSDSWYAQEVKHTLRVDLLTARRSRSEADIAAARLRVATGVLTRLVADEAAGRRWQCVAGYKPLRTEPGSIALLDALAERGLRVLVPLTLDDRDLDWVEWSSPADPLGVDAIGAADVVLVPALGVDARGTRLGRGGGSYDRALRRVRPGVPVAALLYADEVVAELPADPWDVPVTAVVTPDGWRDLGTDQM